MNGVLSTSHVICKCYRDCHIAVVYSVDISKLYLRLVLVYVEMGSCCSFISTLVGNGHGEIILTFLIICVLLAPCSAVTLYIEVLRILIHCYISIILCDNSVLKRLELFLHTNSE